MVPLGTLCFIVLITWSVPVWSQDGCEIPLELVYEYTAAMDDEINHGRSSVINGTVLNVRCRFGDTYDLSGDKYDDSDHPTVQCINGQLGTPNISCPNGSGNAASLMFKHQSRNMTEFFITRTGYITSPGFPDTYPENGVYRWTLNLTLTEETHVGIQFIDISLREFKELSDEKEWSDDELYRSMMSETESVTEGDETVTSYSRQLETGYDESKNKTTDLTEKGLNNHECSKSQNDFAETGDQKQYDVGNCDSQNKVNNATEVTGEGQKQAESHDSRESNVAARAYQDAGVVISENGRIGKECDDDNMGDTSSSDDNIPLSKLRIKRLNLQAKKPVRRKLLEDDIEFSDDSFRDESYNPDKDEINSTDSETKELKKNRQKKRIYSKGTRNYSWKKKPSTCKIKKVKKIQTHQTILQEKLRKTIKLLNEKRKRKEQLDHEVTDVDKAVRRSRVLASLKVQTKKLHETRLDHLLAANEKTRVKIAADGNCFFAAVLESMDDKGFEDVAAFRNAVCDYMQHNKETYLPFMTKDSDDINQGDVFDKEVASLRCSGHWNVSIGDCMPLAVADKLGCLLRIYSSSLSTPIINIKPSAWEHTGSYKLIEIAYLAIRQDEHYDATQRVNAQLNKGKPCSEFTTTNKDVAPNEEEILTDERHTKSTPHKRADYQSPEKKLSSRKRKRNQSEWKSSVRKRKRLAGKSYESRRGMLVKEKQVQPQNCDRCKFKCNTKFSESDRQNIFDMYYSLPSYERQRCFICDVVSKSSPVRKKIGRKTKALKYHLPSGNKNVRVCARFFRKTLDIGHKLVGYTVERKIHGTFQGKDMRGHHPPATKIDAKRVKLICDHINSFPRMESHYTRKGSKKQYLAHDLNIKKMWNLYNDWCISKAYVPVKEAKYREVFCEKFNLSFYKPKKDQCSVCTKYDQHKTAGTVTTEMKEQYECHQKRKIEAREEKAKDKERAKKDKSYYVATFDLQAVLTTPCALVSELYYSRKLCCYNLTVYNLGDKQVFCHLWDESHGKRGSCEIATCLLKSTQSFCSGKAVEVTYYSDTCGGQNRNKYVAASYLYTIAKIPQLRAINHKFLQSGHSQMECDVVHSTIEQAKKITSIYVPSQWSTVISMARKSNPYVTVPLKFDHVLDFKSLVSKCHLNLQTTTEGEKINWLKVRWLRVEQEHPTTLLINYTFEEKEFKNVDIMQSSTRSKGRLQKSLPCKDSEMERCYNERLPISTQKKADLVKLCAKEIVPEDFHAYFANLPTSKMCKDKIPENSDDEDDETN